ncbi:glycine betaine ABC transporter substrate-binding protein [Caulobacter soli]|uniref:glycine betaine ABC transporter substrate-binding protein n=1 Tax=Caulobacter soli TaxID=2708539 RepID=UPI0013ECDA4A|nr:glycine betaine ABC transporter substrate-binding protein [Caulobacter soli]
MTPGKRVRTSGDTTTLVMGQVTHSLNAAVGAVVQELLERIGCRVSVVTGGYDEIFLLLEEGAIDLMAAVWLPDAHADLWARHGAGAEEIASLYDGAHFFWAVPDYVPQDLVATIADLSQPTVIERMTPLILANGPSTVLSLKSQDAMAAYGLDAVGYHFRSGSPGEWVGAYEAALAERRWFVFPTWTPQFLNRDERLRTLADPIGVLGGRNHGVLVAPAGRLEAISPRARQMLAHLKIGLDGVTEMDRLINVDKRTPKNAALAWMSANSRRVEAWLRG